MLSGKRFYIYAIIICMALLASCNNREQMHALYEEGLEQMKLHRYEEAIKALSKAEQLAEEMEESYHAGVICSKMHEVYNANEDRNMALLYAYNAYNHFQKTDSINLINNSYLNLAIAYSRMNYYYESEPIFRKIYQTAKQTNDQQMLDRCLEHYIPNLLFLQHPNHFNTAKRLLDEHKPRTEMHYAVLAYLHMLDNCPDSASIALAAIKNSYPRDERQPLLESEIYAMKGDTLAAYAKLKNSYYGLKQRVNTNSKKSLVVMQKRAAEREALIQKQIAKERQGKYIITICSLILLLSLSCAYIMDIRKRRQAETERNILLIEELTNKESVAKRALQQVEEQAQVELLKKEEQVQRELQQIEEQVQIAIQEKEELARKELLLKEEQIRELYRARFKDITELATDYYSYGSNPHVIYNKVKQSINKLLEDNQTAEQLEQIINHYHNNIVAYLRENVDGLTENDCRLFCYYCSGFSPQLISMLANNKIDNIYKQKSRLKQKISSCTPLERKEEILQMIS